MVLSRLGREKSLAELDGKLSGCQLPGYRRIFPFFGDVA
jgi:hypothetical protein